MQRFLDVGKVVSTHGIAGEMKVYPWADSANSLRKLKNVYWDKEGSTPLKVESARVHKNTLLLKVEGVDSIDAARRYIDRTVYADRDDIIKENGEYFVVDLLGAEVRNSLDGSRIGTLSDVTDTGVQNIYHVTLDDGSVRMVPAVPAFVKRVDLDEMVVEIEPIKGMFDDAD